MVVPEGNRQETINCVVVWNNWVVVWHNWVVVWHNWVVVWHNWVVDAMAFKMRLTHREIDPESEIISAHGGPEPLSYRFRMHHVNPLMPVGNYSYQFFICCPRDCVSRHNGGTRGV